MHNAGVLRIYIVTWFIGPATQFLVFIVGGERNTPGHLAYPVVQGRNSHTSRAPSIRYHQLSAQLRNAP